MQKNSKKEQYPIEFPSRESTIKHSPIVDNIDSEPIELSSPYKNLPYYNESLIDVPEIISTEIISDMAGRTIHEPQM